MALIAIECISPVVARDDISTGRGLVFHPFSVRVKRICGPDVIRSVNQAHGRLTVKAPTGALSVLRCLCIFQLLPYILFSERNPE